MYRGRKQSVIDIRRNRQAKHDDLIHHNDASGMESFRRKPYYLSNGEKKRHRSCTYSFPVSVGDTVYEIYGGHIYALTVSGFHISENDQYVVVREGQSSNRIHISNIYTSMEQAAEMIRKEKAEYEKKSQNGSSIIKNMGRG